MTKKANCLSTQVFRKLYCPQNYKLICMATALFLKDGKDYETSNSNPELWEYFDTEKKVNDQE